MKEEVFMKEEVKIISMVCIADGKPRKDQLIFAVNTGKGQERKEDTIAKEKELRDIFHGQS